MAYSDIALQVPERSGDVLLLPSGIDLIELGRANRRRLDEVSVRIAGVPLRDVRARARDEITRLATRYTTALGGGHPDTGAGDLLLATGHQPVIAHPGIWVKYLLLDRLARHGHAAIAGIVDTDTMEALRVEVPVRRGLFLERRTEMLRRDEPDVPFEAQPPVSQQEWDRFIAALDPHLATLTAPEIRAQWESFRNAPRPDAGSLPAFISALRRLKEGPRRFLEVPVSVVSETEAFRLLVLAIVRDSDRFAEIHNRQLVDYRQKQHIRTDVQPFANLEVDGARVELPFWSVQGRRRVRLFLDRERGTMHPVEGTPLPIPSRVDDPVFRRLQIRPRALTLTTFFRMCLADLFIHGLGGGRYDRVSDTVMAEFFGVEPPVYVVASATLHLPFRESVDPEPSRQSLQRMLLDARHNPERLLSDPPSPQRTLIEEKWRLIHRLEDPGLTHRERRSATQEIRRINERLTATLAGRVSELEAAMAALDGRAPASDAATYRGYPYFLFDVPAVEDLVSKMLGTDVK